MRTHSSAATEEMSMKCHLVQDSCRRNCQTLGAFFDLCFRLFEAAFHAGDRTIKRLNACHCDSKNEFFIHAADAAD